jgi:hypothetical protein
MPGQPETREMLSAITAAGGAPRLLERIAGGETIIEIAKSLDISRQIISKLLNSDDHREALRSARKEAASGLAEESLMIADRATIESVQVAKLQTDVRRWMAGKWDRETYGEQKGSQVTINLASLHIDALRRNNREAQVAPLELAG